MRILLCVHQFFPENSLGTERYTLALAKGLLGLGHEVRVLTGSRPAARPAPIIFDYEHEGVGVTAVNLGASPPCGIGDHHSRPDLPHLYRKILVRFRPDLVHVTHLLDLGIEFLQVCREFGIPAVMTFTDLWSFCWAGQCIQPHDGSLCRGPDSRGVNCAVDFLRSRRNFAAGTPLENAIRRADTILPGFPAARVAAQLPHIALHNLAPDFHAVLQRNGQIRSALKAVSHAFFPSRFLLDSFAAQGLHFEKSTVLPYGIRLPDEAETKFLAAPPGDRPPTFAFIGQLSRHKGLLILLEAFRQASIPHARLRIHGRFNPGDPDAGMLEARIAATPGASLEGYFSGNEIYDVISGCDAVVLPSLWHENAPLVLLETLAAGRPAIVSDGKGMREFVRHRENGLITRMGDISSLRDALIEFCAAGCRLPGIDALRPAFSLSEQDHARILSEGHYPAVSGTLHLPTPRPGPSFDLADFVGLQLVEFSAPRAAGAIAMLLARARLRGCEVRLPQDRSWGPEPAGLEGRRPAASRPGRLGSTFPKLDSGTLLLRTHNKPFVSIWGRKTRRVMLSSLDDLPESGRLVFCARAKMAKRACLILQGAFRRDGGGTIESAFSWNWPGKDWLEICVDLAAIRCAGIEINQLILVPVQARGAWKMDILSCSLEPGRGGAAESAQGPAGIPRSSQRGDATLDRITSGPA